MKTLSLLLLSSIITLTVHASDKRYSTPYGKLYELREKHIAVALENCTEENRQKLLRPLKKLYNKKEQSLSADLWRTSGTAEEEACQEAYIARYIHEIALIEKAHQLANGKTTITQPQKPIFPIIQSAKVPNATPLEQSYKEKKHSIIERLVGKRDIKK